MPRNNIPRCRRCVNLEEAHDLEMEFFISLVDEQSRLLRKRQFQAARDCDMGIRMAKVRHERAIEALLAHNKEHQRALNSGREEENEIEFSPLPYPSQDGLL